VISGQFTVLLSQLTANSRQCVAIHEALQDWQPPTDH